MLLSDLKWAYLLEEMTRIQNFHTSNIIGVVGSSPVARLSKKGDQLEISEVGENKELLFHNFFKQDFSPSFLGEYFGRKQKRQIGPCT